MYVSALATVSIENRIARVLSRGGAESDFNTFPSLSRVVRIRKTGGIILRTLIFVDGLFQDTPASSAVRSINYRRFSRSLLYEVE